MCSSAQRSPPRRSSGQPPPAAAAAGRGSGHYYCPDHDASSRNYISALPKIFAITALAIVANGGLRPNTTPVDVIVPNFTSSSNIFVNDRNHITMRRAQISDVVTNNSGSYNYNKVMHLLQIDVATPHLPLDDHGYYSALDTDLLQVLRSTDLTRRSISHTVPPERIRKYVQPKVYSTSYMDIPFSVHLQEQPSLQLLYPMVRAAPIRGLSNYTQVISSDFELLPQYLRYGRYHDVITHHFPIQLQHDKSGIHSYQENSFIAARNVVG